VGGSVRDLELGYAAPDVDLVVDGDAAAVAADIAGMLDAPWFALSERHRAFRVVDRRGHVDVAAMRGGGILADLAQRDFTVNAMAMPVLGGELVDPFGGLADLHARRLVAVSDHIFLDDPLRLMRAPRFSHILGLALERDLFKAVRDQAGELDRAAPERVAAEIIMTLGAGRAGDAARLWHDLGLLRVLVPEIADPGGLSQVFALLDRLEAMLADPREWFPDVSGVLGERLGRRVDGATERPVALRLAGLVCGLGPGGAAAVGRRLRLSGTLISMLEATGGVCRDGEKGSGLPVTVSDRAPGPGRGSGRIAGAGPGREVVLFFWRTAPWEPEAILLGAAGTAGTPDKRAVPLEWARALMALWAERAVSGVPRLPLDGDAVMEYLQLPPGPQLGKALRAARLAWEAGEATTAAEALAAAREDIREG
jgi:hypothetical protein